MPLRAILFLVALGFGGFATHAVSQEQLTPVLTFRAHNDVITRIQFSPDGKELATASGDKTAALWDAATGKKWFTLRGHKDFLAGLAFSPDSKYLATASGDGTVKLWDTRTGRNTLALRGHRAWVYAVAFNPDGSQLATGDGAALDQAEEHFTGEIKFWDVASGKHGKTFRGHTNFVLTLAFSPDGKRLASGSVDGSAVIWDIAAGKAIHKLRVHQVETLYEDEEVLDLAFSPDGKVLATACADSLIKLWDVTSGKHTLALRGHKGRALAVRFSPDGTLLASAGIHLEERQPDWSGDVRVWDAKTGKLKAVLDKDPSGSYAVAFSPDGKRLATAHGNGTVKVWDVARLVNQKSGK